MHCTHVKALLLKVGHQVNSVDWHDERYHVSTYKASYSAAIPAMATAGKLIADDSFYPPDYKRPAGRPTKKRKERNYVRTSDAKRECKACRELGHFALTCKNPSTEFRLNAHKEKALKWCDKQETICLD
jgi:hypothetical protein